MSKYETTLKFLFYHLAEKNKEYLDVCKLVEATGDRAPRKKRDKLSKDINDIMKLIEIQEHYVTGA